jgi:peptidoglycan/xylan/chitin deacetylase (PgdA/CDA1 family)
MNKNIQNFFIVLILLLTSGCGGSKVPNDSNKTQTEPESSGNLSVLEDNENIIEEANSTNLSVPEDSENIIEDAEDGKIERWEIVYDDSKKAKITNIYDEERASNVIYLDGDERSSSFELKQTLNDTNGTKKRYLQWKMKTEESFVVQIMIESDKGEKFLTYHPKDTGKGYYSHDGKYFRHLIGHGIGSNATDGEWHTYTRDIELDLKRYEKDNQLVAIKKIFIRGKVKIDDIFFYNTSKKLKIDKPVVVSAPGIVLTFDDSYIDNWAKVMQDFREKGVVATFFCYRWGFTEYDFRNDEIKNLKEFASDGHEIAYHTVSHADTRDPKYYGTIETKAQEYFNNEITPGIDNMMKRGFEKPTSFSYPYVSGQAEHNKIIRKTLPHIREFFAHMMSIDEIDKYSLETVKGFLDKYKKDREIGVFLGHWILDDNFEPNNIRYKYRTSKKKLMEIIDYANKIGLKFYTLEEAHKIYMKQ